MIKISEPFVPNLSEYEAILAQIWKDKIFTNSGPNLNHFKERLKEYLEVPSCSLVANGTVSLELSLKALNLKGEVIAPAFSWIATHSAIINAGCYPKYCDINKNTLNIDIASLEAAISEDTVAIMPVHVFGNPVDVISVESVAKKYNLKVIYDAAHAFGSTLNGKSIFNYGDISSSSFHATKIVNAAEGGICISKNQELIENIDKLRFYGFDSNKNVIMDGTNAKMSELNASLGLCSLNHANSILDRRKKVKDIFKAEITIKEITFQKYEIGESNFSYFPLILKDEKTTLDLMEFLQKNGIETRRYFYPSLSKLGIFRNNFNTPVSEDIATRIICIPNHYNISDQQASDISKTVNKFFDL